MRNAPAGAIVHTTMRRRSILGGALIVVLLVVVTLTSAFRPTATSRPHPSDEGAIIEREAPFEFGSVNDSQSFR